MGKKKAPKNAFYYFFTELKERQKQPISNERAVELAGPIWNTMGPEQRRPYEEKAKLAKRNQAKETCAGESIFVVLQEEKTKIQQDQRTKTEIETMVKLAYSNGSLADTHFYILHINYFFYHDMNQKYYPAEIAVGRFNLKNGIIKEDVYHSFIYPGKFPVGYQLTARQIAEESHKLPTDFGNKNNMLEVIENVIDYNKDQAPFFVFEKDISDTEKMLQNMFAEFEYECSFNIYPLDYLLFILKNIVHGPENKVWPVTSIGTTTLEKDLYSMCEEIACGYHQVVERQAYCSLSKIIRYAYTICDNCSFFLGIELIPGRHVPPKSDVNNVIVSKLMPGISQTNISKTYSQISREEKTMTNASLPRQSSATQSVQYDSEVGSYGFQSCDDDEDEWKVPKRSVRLRGNYPISGAEDGLTGSQSQPGLTGSQTQSTSQSQPFNLSMSSKPSSHLRRPESISEVGYRGRGRGRFYKRPE